MKLWPFGNRVEQKSLDINDVIKRFEALFKTSSGISVNGENCMKSPTVHAVVTAVSNRLGVSPLQIMRKSVRDGREYKEPIPDHPLALLFARPNAYQNRTTYWMDTTSELMRYGNSTQLMQRTTRSRVISLNPVAVPHVSADLTDRGELIYQVNEPGGTQQTVGAERVFHIRNKGRKFYWGDSPVHDVRNAIALEIAAEEFGGTFFANGAMPLMIFKMMEGFAGWETEEQEQAFIHSLKQKLSGRKRFSGFLLPKGLDVDAESGSIDNEKTQLVESRKYQRTVIAGAFGVPPHLVGDLERATFNNVEQQDSDFTINVVLPVARMIESAIEAQLLTRQERLGGVIVRFNLDAIQRADFKSRQEGLQIQRLNGIISADEWREAEGRNPLPDDQGGEEHWRPSNMSLASQPPEVVANGTQSSPAEPESDDEPED